MEVSFVFDRHHLCTSRPRSGGMKRLLLALELFFQGGHDSESDNSESDSTLLEIKGVIFLLITVFLLISLTSYIPIDSYHLFQQRFDHMSNLGGIVGAILSELILGTTGVAGFTTIALTLWFAALTFMGKGISSRKVEISGVTLGTLFTSITCQLLWGEGQPEVSLLQGGWVGTHIGVWLKGYFNQTGAIVLIAGGYLTTFMLTTRFSFIQGFRSLFGEVEGEVENRQSSRSKRKSSPKKESQATPPAKAKRKKKTDDESADPDEESNEADEDETDENEEGSDEKENLAEIDPNEFQEMIPFSGGYSLPSPRLMKGDKGNAKKMSRGEMKENARKLVEHLLSFQISGEITSVSQGPVLTTYEFKPDAGMKLSKIAALQDDLGVVLGVGELRIIAPIPGKTVVGIEVPRPSIETIPLKDIIAGDDFYDKKIKLPIALGKTTDGNTVVGDMAAMPHLLVSGSTGSGKSVFINSLILSLIYRLSPQQLRLILIDPKMLELNAFQGLPHLITDVITNNNVAFNAMNWAVKEMDRRYQLMAETGAKNIDSYNAKQRNKIPYIVIVVDELADLMMSGGQEIEVAITRLAQKARAAGIHLVLATQRPSTDVVTGLIKANIPSRISFKVPSAIDSRTVLDCSGAEALIGRGDSLMIQPAIPLRRLHGCFVTEEELARVVKNIKGSKNFSRYYIQFSSKKSDE